jgi:hypothetical protein
MLDDLMSPLYFPDRRDTDIFGDHYKPPKKFQYGKWHRIVTLRKEKRGDGGDAFIFECRMPARFFKVVVPDYENSVGEKKKGFTLQTGSGDEMGKLAMQIAHAASKGMLGLYEEDEETDE